MPKKTYVGIDNKAENIPNKGYIGIVNKAKKLIKGYVGDVNGKAQLFWGGILIQDFWKFFETLANVEVISIYVRNYKKTDNGIAYYASFYGRYSNSLCYSPLFVSTDPDAVTYTYFTADAPVTYKGTLEINGDTWYWAAYGGQMVRGTYTHNPPYFLGDTYNANVDMSAPARDLIERIYASGFVENYSVGKTYKFVLGNKEDAVRRAISVCLFKSIDLKNDNRYSALYNYILENFDDLVWGILQHIGKDNVIIIEVNLRGEYFIKVWSAFVNSFGNITITDGIVYGGFDFLYFSNAISVTKLFGLKYSYNKVLYEYITPENTIRNMGIYAMSGLAQFSNVGQRGKSGIWEDYVIQRLVFDYDYTVDNNYTRHWANISDTVRYFINKTIFWNSSTERDTLNDSYFVLLSKKVDEIVSYVESLLLPTDNQVLCQTGFSNYNSIYFIFSVGSSSLSNLNIVYYSYDAYKQVAYNTQTFATSRIYIRITMDSQGNLTKTSDTYSRGMEYVMGNHHDVYGQEHNYLNYLVNVGVHFEYYNSKDLIANWDFTKSLYDTVENLCACEDIRWGDSTIDNTGLHKSVSDDLDLPSWLMRYGNTLEITVGNYTLNEYNNCLICWFNRNSCIFEYRNGEGWRFWDSNQVGSSGEPIGNLDSSLFKNSTIKIRWDEDRFLSIYKNNVLLYKTVRIKMTDLARTGSEMRLLSSMAVDVKKVKIYNS